MVETGVHFPSDTSLLFDAMRKVITLSAQWCDEHGISQWRQYAYNVRHLKRHLRTAQNSKRSKARSEQQQQDNATRIVDAHQDYLDLAEHYLEKAQATLALLASHGCSN